MYFFCLLHFITKRSIMIKFLCCIIVVCYTYTAFSQNKQEDLIGEWKRDYKYSDANLWKLDRVNNNTRGDGGIFIRFNEDKTYDQFTSAFCGLDVNSYRISGKWELQNNKIILQIDIKNSYIGPNNKFTLLETGEIKIIRVKKNKLKLHIIKNWEEKFLE